MKERNQSMFRLADGTSVLLTFALVSSLFLLWGFCNGMIDVMDKHFQNELHLTLSQSAWVQFAHYLGYFLMALPAGWCAIRLGYKGGIIAGLLMVAVGGFWFIPATHLAKFWAFLLGVCTIAAGLTFLETIANPYTTVLGPGKFAAARINLAQSCNGIGWFFGPIAGSLFFYGKDSSGASTGSQTLWIPYVGVAVVVVVLALLFWFARVPDIKTEDEYHLDDAPVGVNRSIWSHPHFVMAVAAQFFYVAAQAGIFSFLINYMTSQVPPIPASWDAAMSTAANSMQHFVDNVPAWFGWFFKWVPGWLRGWFEVGGDGFVHFSDQGAANLASLGFLVFLTGRFSGAAILKRFPAHGLLGLYGLANVVVCFLIFLKLGWLSVACVFLSYFFMSIMFPTIFALGIHGLGARAKRASGYIVMAIMGGAIVPKLMGWVGDNYGVSRSFIVPLACFTVVAFYGFSWAKLSRPGSPAPMAAPAGVAHE